jgi:hypothetical protein
LLLEGGKETWSAAAAATDTDFTSLKTVDAQLLPRIHDATCSPRLPQDFKTLLETIRRRRNAATHGVVAMLAPNVGIMIHDILEISHSLLGAYCWPKIVREDAYSGPAPWADYHGTTQRGLLESWRQTLQFLTASDYVRYLGFSKKQRLYLCPDCHTGDIAPDPPIKLAYLSPNSPTATDLHCFVCDSKTTVARTKCSSCKGNVLAEDYGERHCLSCGGRSDRALIKRQ